MYAFLLIVIIIVVIVWWRAPIIGTEWSKQTLYVGLLDAWYGGSSDDRAHALWIDDDSTEGVFKVKKIADEVGIQPCFAVIADRMTPEVADSLAAWQQQGAGIVLHGYRHEKWWEWTEEQIKEDFTLSYQRLQEQGFDTTRIIKMAAPPHGCNYYRKHTSGKASLFSVPIPRFLLFSPRRRHAISCRWQRRWGSILILNKIFDILSNYFTTQQ